MKDSKSASAPGKAGDADGGGAAPAKKGRKKLFAGVAVLVVAGGAAGWTFFGPGASAEAAEKEPEPPVLGEVLVIDPISINLADGHYLKLGMGLQAVAEPEHAPEGSKALDAAIALYSGKPISELSDPEGRKVLKDELTRTINEEYHDEIVDVYFREYVMQ